MSAPLLLAVILAGAIPGALALAHRRDPAFVDRWARARDLELTPASRPVVERYLHRVRVLRTWGGVGGAVLPSFAEYAVSGRVQVLGFGTDGNSAPLAFGAIFAGYLLGVLCAEISLPRPIHTSHPIDTSHPSQTSHTSHPSHTAPPSHTARPIGTRRVASLVPRDLEQYLPRHSVVAQRATAAAGAIGTVAIGLVPYSASVSSPSVGALGVWAAAILALAAGLEAVERWIVRRPQPFMGRDLVAADDAIRAQSIQAFASAGLALLLLYCCGIALALQASQSPALQASMGLLAGVLLVLSLLACRGVDAQADSTSRSRPAGESA